MIRNEFYTRMFDSQGHYNDRFLPLCELFDQNISSMLKEEERSKALYVDTGVDTVLYIPFFKYQKYGCLELFSECDIPPEKVLIKSEQNYINYSMFTRDRIRNMDYMTNLKERCDAFVSNYDDVGTIYFCAPILIND